VQVPNYAPFYPAFKNARTSFHDDVRSRRAQRLPFMCRPAEPTEGTGQGGQPNPGAGARRFRRQEVLLALQKEHPEAESAHSRPCSGAGKFRRPHPRNGPHGSTICPMLFLPAFPPPSANNTLTPTYVPQKGFSEFLKSDKAAILSNETGGGGERAAGLGCTRK